jgi:hypothetical protein
MPHDFHYSAPVAVGLPSGQRRADIVGQLIRHPMLPSFFTHTVLLFGSVVSSRSFIVRSMLPTSNTIVN